MKSVVIALALIAVVMGAQMSVSKNTQKHIENLRDSKWGKTLLNFMQLHAAVQGPVQELIDAIGELIEDLNEQLQDLEFNFQQRTNEHNSLVIQLEQDIQDAVSDVARMEDVLNNLLYPRREQIQNKIDAINQNIAFNRQTVHENTLLREQEHAEYEAQVEELNNATAGVDEALALIESLSNPSLIQIKKFRSSIEKISKRTWKRVKQGPMVQALLQLALNQNFSDQGILRQIVDALNEFRAQIVDSLNELTAQEAENLQNYNERIEQLDAELAEFQRQVVNQTTDLTATNNKIDECNEFHAQREADRKSFAAQLDLENETYANETEIYTNLKNEYLRELAVSEQAFNLVNSADFGDSVRI